MPAQQQAVIVVCHLDQTVIRFDNMLTFKNHQFIVDTNSNKRIYNLLKSDVDNYKTDEIISYYLINRNIFLSKEILDFLNQVGVDTQKENEIFHYNIDKNQTVIEGWYDIVGKIVDVQQFSLYWYTEFSTTNISFSNNIKNVIRKEFINNRTFRFDFSIVVSATNLRLDLKTNF